MFSFTKFPYCPWWNEFSRGKFGQSTGNERTFSISHLVQDEEDTSLNGTFFFSLKKKGTDVTNLNLIEKWKFGGIYLFNIIL